MAKKILAKTQMKTPADAILDERWEGDYQIFCAAYSASAQPVKLQQRVPTQNIKPEAGWVDAKFEGNDIQLAAAGDTIIVTLARGYDYRLKTSVIGAEVYIDKLDSHR
jgi:hypothetical protein